MSEQKDQFIAQLFTLEMNGKISQSQKDTMLSQLNLLLQDPIRKRDALEVSDLQKLQSRLNAIRLAHPVTFLDYLRDLFLEGQRILFTLFEVLGIVLIFFPLSGQWLIVIRVIGGLIFLVSFLLANYNLYKNWHEPSRHLNSVHDTHS